jgi:hypothetical protein
LPFIEQDTLYDNGNFTTETLKEYWTIGGKKYYTWTKGGTFHEVWETQTYNYCFWPRENPAESKTLNGIYYIFSPGDVPIYRGPADYTYHPGYFNVSYLANAQVFTGKINVSQVGDGTSNTVFFAEGYAYKFEFTDPTQKGYGTSYGNNGTKAYYYDSTYNRHRVLEWRTNGLIYGAYRISYRSGSNIWSGDYTEADRVNTFDVIPGIPIPFEVVPVPNQGVSVEHWNSQTDSWYFTTEVRYVYYSGTNSYGNWTYKSDRFSDILPIGNFKTGLLVAMGDGSVRNVSKSVSMTSWVAAVSPNGGDVPGPDW